MARLIWLICPAVTAVVAAGCADLDRRDNIAPGHTFGKGGVIRRDARPAVTPAVQAKSESAKPAAELAIETPPIQVRVSRPAKEAGDLADTPYAPTKPNPYTRVTYYHADGGAFTRQPAGRD